MVRQLNPLSDEISKLARRSVENAKLVKQDVNHLQHAILEVRNEFVVQQQNATGKEAVQARLAKSLEASRSTFGPRNNFKGVKEYFKGALEKQHIEKFYLQANMFDPRLESLTENKVYQGEKAPHFLAHKDQRTWMEAHKLGVKHQEEQRQKDFIKDIFIAIDEDGNGTMEMDELIKALLSLCLSQDIRFAKQILYLFEENMVLQQSKRDPRFRLLGEKVAKTRSEREGLKYSFRDFLKIFKTDPVGTRIVEVLSKEIVLARQRREKKARENQEQESQKHHQRSLKLLDSLGPVSCEPPRSSLEAMLQRMRTRVEEHFLNPEASIRSDESLMELAHSDSFATDFNSEDREAEEDPESPGAAGGLPELSQPKEAPYSSAVSRTQDSLAMRASG